MTTTPLFTRLSDLNIRPERPDSILLNRIIAENEDLQATIGYELIQTPLFQNGELSLYCGVPASLLLPENAPPLQEYLDFVVCRGQDAILAVKLGNPCDQLLHALQADAALPVIYQLSSPSPLEGQFDVYDLEFIMAQQLTRDSPSVTVSFCPIPSRLLKRLSAPAVCVLEARPASGGGRKFWFPTEYGRSAGILQGFRTDKNNRVHAFLGCPRKCLDGLRDVASWGKPGVPELPRGPVPLARRVDMAGQGITAHPGELMDMVRQLGDIPLAEYFRDAPESLQTFQHTFPQASTYRQAAVCLAGQEYQKAFLMEALAGPLIARKDIPLADKPIRSVLFAASLLAKSKYLTWTGEMILHDHDGCHIAGRWTCRQWLKWSVQKIGKLREDPSADLTCFYRVIYYLAISPFVMLSQQSNSNQRR